MAQDRRTAQDVLLLTRERFRLLRELLEMGRADIETHLQNPGGPAPDSPEVATAVLEASNQVELALEEGLGRVLQSLRPAQGSPPKPETRNVNEFPQFKAKDITLDRNTAFHDVILSDDNRKAAVIPGKSMRYPLHQRRFKWYRQVLSSEEFGPGSRCYWEMEWSGKRTVMAVVYDDIEREKDSKSLVANEKSWALACNGTYTSFFSNKTRIDINRELVNRIRVYLDYDKGNLSFYEVQGQTLTLIHRVETKFTRPLQVGLRFRERMWTKPVEGSVEFIQLETPAVGRR